MSQSSLVNEWVEQVRRFHETFGHPVADKPALITENRSDLRYNLIEEELEEFGEAIEEDDLVKIADALGDLIVVVIGASLEYGVPLDKVMAAIDRANMSKLGADGKPIYRESDGKIMKGPNFAPPEDEIRQILLDAGANPAVTHTGEAFRRRM